MAPTLPMSAEILGRGFQYWVEEGGFGYVIQTLGRLLTVDLNAVFTKPKGRFNSSFEKDWKSLGIMFSLIPSFYL